mmetsp:Transcript_22500/g.27583  ORF Transcript_22500/g.27583 Transcript_22500/m.27583 type:complete len:81 (+) Transcript_22500:133-375(+)
MLAEFQENKYFSISSLITRKIDFKMSDFFSLYSSFVFLHHHTFYIVELDLSINNSSFFFPKLPLLFSVSSPKKSHHGLIQ